jgi:CheY-like chemotaxis protein
LNNQKIEGHILVVEDNRTNQHVILAMLKRLGLKAEVVENGQLALEKVMQHADKIDLVLMDVQMPVLDGYSATEQIRVWEENLGRRPLPIIALTADAFAEDQKRCLHAGMNDFLSKPISSQALAQALRRWLAAKD